jgi:hypothetical protein
LNSKQSRLKLSPNKKKKIPIEDNTYFFEELVKAEDDHEVKANETCAATIGENKLKGSINVIRIPNPKLESENLSTKTDMEINEADKMIDDIKGISKYEEKKQ